MTDLKQAMERDLKQGYCIKCEYRNPDQLIDEYTAVMGYDDWKILQRDGRQMIIILTKPDLPKYE
jgi:hypothetical protein